jgi:hypothetical protein
MTPGKGVNGIETAEGRRGGEQLGRMPTFDAL